MQSSEVQAVVSSVLRLKERLPLLRRADQLSAHSNFLLHLLLAELDEVEEELAQDGSARFSLPLLAGEVADMSVFAVSMQLASGGNLGELANNTSKINGQGTRSDVFDIARNLIENSQDDPKALLEAFVLIMSMLHHFSPVSVMDSMQKTIAKVLANRPPELYSDQEDGVLLSDAEAFQKYTFLEKAMRLIRKAVGRTLVQSDWVPYLRFLKNWRNADLNLRLIEGSLQLDAHQSKAYSPEVSIAPAPIRTTNVYTY